MNNLEIARQRVQIAITDEKPTNKQNRNNRADKNTYSRYKITK